MPDFNLDSMLQRSEVYRCAKCGAPLIYGGWQNYFEYCDIDPETGELGPDETGRDYSEGRTVTCSANEKHKIGWTAEQHEAFDERVNRHA